MFASYSLPQLDGMSNGMIALSLPAQSPVRSIQERHPLFTCSAHIRCLQKAMSKVKKNHDERSSSVHIFCLSAESDEQSQVDSSAASSRFSIISRYMTRPLYATICQLSWHQLQLLHEPTRNCSPGSFWSLRERLKMSFTLFAVFKSAS